MSRNVKSWKEHRAAGNSTEAAMLMEIAELRAVLALLETLPRYSPAWCNDGTATMEADGDGEFLKRCDVLTDGPAIRTPGAFGAVGDGVHDDTAAMQRAANWSTAARKINPEG